MYNSFMSNCRLLALPQATAGRAATRTGFNVDLNPRLPRVLAFLVAVVLSLGSETHADTDHQQKVLQQKLSLLHNMLNRGSTVKKIRDSGNAEALTLLKQAEDLYKIADDSIQQGQVANVGDVINDAIRKISASAAKARGQTGSTAAERSRYQELLGNVDSLYTAALNDFTTNIDLDPVIRFREEAQALTDKDDYAEALKKLNSAYQYIVNQMADSVTTKTVVYNLDFKTSKDEYEYELRRYNDNRDLVSRLLFEHEKNPTRMLIERYTEQADKTFQLAQNHASQDQHDEALQTIERANRELKRSMGMLGLNF